MDSYSPRNKEYPSLSYQKSPRTGRRGDRISIGNLKENLVGGEKKRHIKNYNEGYGDERFHGKTDGHNREYQPRRRRQSDDDDYDEEFRRMSIGSPIPNTLVNPDGSPRKQVKGQHYPSIKVDQVKETNGRSRGRFNNRQENRYQEEYQDGEEEQKIPKSPASPLISPRSRNGDQVTERPRRIPPPSSPRLLRSRSPNNLSPRTPSPSPRKAGGKEYIAYYEEDVELRAKSTSPRDKKQERIPSLGNRVNADSQPSYSKKKSPRDHDGNFDWNDYISPRSKTNSHYDDECDERNSSHRSKASPREYQANNGRRRERGRDSVESPPLSPLSSSGGSSSRSPRESPRSPEGMRSSWDSPRSERDYLSSSGDRSPRDDPRPTHVVPVPVPRRKKQGPTGGKLEPIEYR